MRWSCRRRRGDGVPGRGEGRGGRAAPRARRSPAAAALTAAILAAAAAGCGGGSGDLMAIDASGGTAGRPDVEIVVANDGRGSCNGGSEGEIPSQLVIDARELERDLGDLAEKGAAYEPTRAGRRAYVVRIKAGTVRWGEGEPGLPQVLPRTQLVALRLERLLCRG